MKEQSSNKISIEQEPTSGITTNVNVKVTTKIEISEKFNLPSNSLSSFNKTIIEKAISNKIESQLSKNSKSLNDLSYIKKDNAYTSINIVTQPIKFKSSSLGCIETILQKENKKFESEERFVIVNAQVEEPTYPNNPTFYDPDDSRQHIIVVRSDYARRPPPPYEYRQPRPQSYSYPSMAGPRPPYQPSNMGYCMGMSQDPTESPTYRRGDVDVGNVFNTREIRNKFIRKVYLILAIQLLFTFGFISLCIYEKNTREFVKRQWLLMIQAMIALFFLMITLFCYTEARRTYPINFILLSFLTLCMAYVMAALSCYYETKIVMISMGATSGVCILISIFAWQSQFDVTRWGMMILVACLIVLGYGIFAAIIRTVTGSNMGYLMFACLITLLFCVYLMYDTQKILGGRRIEISPEEYILGAITLYVDIMIIFHHVAFLGTHCR